MFFNQSLISPDRKKQPHQILERVVSKPEKGLDELKEYLNVRVQQKDYSEIESILNYITFRHTHQINAATRIILIQCFQLIALSVKDIPRDSQLASQIPNTIQLILNYFSDPFQKVRYQSIASIYNIIAFYSTLDFDKNIDTAFLPMFTKTFSYLLRLVTDETSEIKLVIFHLNHALKRLMNLLIENEGYFDVNEFMALLIENFITESSASLKEFLIDWLIAIDQIPQFQISFYLPLVFRQLFKLMEGDNQALKDKSEQCLKNLLAGFKELLRNRIRIDKKIRQDSFSMLIGVLLQVIKQTLHPKIKHHSLQWLQVFTQLFANQLVKKQHVEVRRSFRGELLIKQMKQPKNHQRASKILSFIREEMVQIEQQNDELNLLSGIDFLPTPRIKDGNAKMQDVVQEDGVDDEQIQNYRSLHLDKAVTQQRKVTEFLVEIFLSFYDKIIVLVMHSFSDDDEKIRRITTSINNILLQSFPIVQQKARISKTQFPVHTIITSQSQNYLQKLEIPLIIKLGKFLKQSRTSHKIQAIIKWIKILYEKGTNPQLNLQISQLIHKIVQKICQKPPNPISHPTEKFINLNQKSMPFPMSYYQSGQAFNFNKSLFALLADSIFMQKYLDLFIQTLLSYFYQNQGIDFQRILIDVISMKVDYRKENTANQIEKDENDMEQATQHKHHSTEIIYITILKRLMLFETEKGKFKKKMVQNMISILITQNSLSSLRQKLRNTPIRLKYLKNPHKSIQSISNTHITQLISQLFQCFCLNQGFTIIFCFLTGMYSLITKIITYIAEENLLDRAKIKSFIRASNLLECYNLNHCKIDVLHNYQALKAYLGFLMVIPPSKLNKVLLNRFPEGFQIQNQEYQEVNNQFEAQLLKKYIKATEKYQQEIILIEKMEEKRKQRQRQTSITLQLNKELRMQNKPKSKSILKQSSSRVLKQSQSEKNLKPSPSFKLLSSRQPFNLPQQQISLKPSKSQRKFYPGTIVQTQESLQSQFSYNPKYQKSDQSLQPLEKPNQLQKSNQFQKSSQQLDKSLQNLQNYRLRKISEQVQSGPLGESSEFVLQEEQEPKRKKKQSKIKVVDMKIQ